MAATTLMPDTMPAVMLAANAATHTVGPTAPKCGTSAWKTSMQTTATERVDGDVEHQLERRQPPVHPEGEDGSRSPGRAGSPRKG